MQTAELERVFAIAQELDAAGRRRDAELLARLAAEASTALDPNLSEDELERTLEQGDVDIAAGRYISDEDLWARIDGAKRAKKTS